VKRFDIVLNSRLAVNSSWIKYLPGFLRDRLSDRHRLQSILGNSSWLLADKALRMGVGLVVGVWLARYLGPDRFGQFNYAIAFVALFSPIAIFGLDAIVVRELVRHPERKQEILGSAFSIRLGGGVLAFSLALSAILVFRSGDRLSQWLVGIIAAGMIFQVVDIADLWFQSQVRSRYSVFAKNGAFLVLTAVKIGLILSHSGLVAFAWVATAEIALGALGLSIAFSVTGNRWLDLRPSWRGVSALLKECWPLLLSGLAAMLYLRIDQVLLVQMVGEREAGLYSAAVRLSELWYLIPPVIASSVTPYLTEARAESETVYYQRLLQLFTLLARAAYMVAIPVTLLAGPLIGLIFGDAYMQAGEVLAIHVWTILFVFLGAGAVPWIINERLTRLALFQTGLGAVTNIALNLYLIPLHGAIGAAMAAVGSQCVSTWLANGILIDGRKLFRLQAKALLLAFRLKNPAV